MARERNKKNINRNRRSQATLFADGMILYLKDPKDSTRRLFGPDIHFIKVSGYKINIPKTAAFLYTNNKIAEKGVRKAVPFTIA
jgi:hypothetical protein